MPEELPALTVPFVVSNTGGSLARLSSVVSARGCSSAETTRSPFLPAMVTGAISSLKRPASIAAAQRFWLPSAIRVLLGARDAQVLRQLLGRLAHAHLRQRAVEAVLVHRVDDVEVAQAVARAHARQVEGQAAHALGAAGDDDPVAAEADRLGREVDRLQARAAGHVDRPGRDALGDAGAHADLARGVRAGAGLARVAEEQLVDALGVERRLGEQRAHDARPEIGAALLGEPTHVLADRRAQGVRDHHRRPVHAFGCSCRAHAGVLGVSRGPGRFRRGERRGLPVRVGPVPGGGRVPRTIGASRIGRLERRCKARRPPAELNSCSARPGLRPRPYTEGRNGFRSGRAGG